MVVIYAEKASLAKTIATALGAGKRIANPKDIYSGHWEFDYNGEAAILCHGAGHLAGLFAPEEYEEKYGKWDINVYPCIPQNYKIKATEPKLLEYIGGFFKRADWLINATDPDREGELIFAYIMEFLGINKPWKRAILSDLTEQTIQNAFENLCNSADMKPLELAGRARAISDWLYGLNLTVAASKRYGSYGNIMNIGRVKTSTLAMVVEREYEIKNFVKTPFYRIMADFQGIVAEHIKGKFEDKNEALQILNEIQGQSGIVTKKTVSPKIESAPLLYNTTKLQAKCVDLFGFDLKKTTDIMQKLYEKGLISYPRTSSEHLSDEMKEDVKLIIQKLFNTEPYIAYKPQKTEHFTKRHFDNSKIGSHTAIIPTQNRAENLTENEWVVYDLVAKSVLRLALPNAEYEETEWIFSVCNHQFKTKITVQKEQGWKVFENKQSKVSTFFIEENSEVKGSYSIKDGETQPPSKYTESSLILAMETKGLGSDATRANIIAELFKNSFIINFKKSKSLIPTDKGLFIIEKLPCEELKSYETTARWEEKLSEIANGGEKAIAFYNNFLTQITENVNIFYQQIKADRTDMFSVNEDENFICPLCKRKLIETKYTYSCSGWNDENEKCDFTVSREISGKPITKSEVKLLCNSGKTVLIQGFKSQSNKLFDAFLVLVKEGIPIKDKQGNPTGKKKYVKFDFPSDKK